MFVISMSSVFLFVCFLTVCHLTKCDKQQQRAAAPLVNSGQEGHPAAQLLPSVCRHEANGSVEIRLPFMDMELRHERHLHVLRSQRLLLVLHGHELFQLQLAGQAKRLVRLGELAGRVRQQLARTAAVVSWREYLLLAVALEESLEFYQLPQRDLLEESHRQPVFEPIQEFALAGGGLQQLHLLQPNPEQVLLLLTLNYTQSQARCRTYEWLETFFNPVEELSLPAIKAFQVVGRQPHYIVAGRSLRGQSRLVLTVYELLTPSLRLQRRQSLTVQARHVLSARFRGRNLLFVCPGSTEASCIVFRMVDGNFVVYRKHVLRQLQFTHLAATELGQLLVGARANGEVLVFNTQRLDCYSGFGADPNPSGIHTHRNPQNESFLLIAYRRHPSTTLLRMVQLGGADDTATLAAPLEGNDDLSSVQQHRHEFEGAINGLRSLLLRRKVQLDLMRQLQQLLQEKQQQQLVNVSELVHLVAGSRVEQVHLQASHLASPSQLQWRMEQLRQRYFRAHNRRFTRSFGVGNQSSAGGQELLKARTLHVRNLIYDGELLPGYSLDLGAAPILTIKGPLLTKQLHAQQLFTPQSYKREQRALGGGQTAVRHLRVERINNVAWFDFYDALFLSTRDNEIEGRLVFQARARVVNLQAQLLNGLVVQKLFNLRQPQVVASNISMSAFYVPKLEAKLVNGLNFAEDIVFRGANKNTLIKTPVRIYQMSVSGDIIVTNATKWPRQMPNQMDSSNLQQYYTGKVILNGSLTVNNVQRDTNGTRLQLNGQSLRAKDLHEDFLLLNKPQNLTTLRFGNAKVTTDTLNTQHINGHPTTEHLITDHDAKTEAGERRVHLIFMNASVDGNIACGNYSSRLAQLAADAVRQGETATIDGHKRFEAPLSVDSISSAVLNGLPSSELVLKSELSPQFTGAKKFARIVVKMQLDIAGELQLERLNQVNLSELLQPAISLQRLELPELPPTQLEHLKFQRLNGLAFDELLGKLSTESGEQEQLLLHKQLIIEGNVRFEKSVQLDTINHIHFDAYTQRLVNANANSFLSGQKRFVERVHITDALHSRSINGLDLSALLQDTLLRTTPQSIGGSYSFQRLVASNLDVPHINGIQASTLLDTRRSKLKLYGDLQLTQLSVAGGFHCAALVNNPLTQLTTQLAALRQRSWPRILVLGDALWNGTKSEQQQLDYLRQHAVRRSGVKQTISGPVRFLQPRLHKVLTSERFPGSLNVSHLAQDALLRRAPGRVQLVEAPQTLLQPVKMVRLQLLDNAQFGLLNGIEPGRLNASLYRRSSGQPIGGQLSFRQAPRIGALQLEGGEGKLNGRTVGGIFQQSADAVWPPVRLQRLQLRQQLQLDEINGMSLEYLLEQRVPLRGAALEQFGTLQFENLVLGERILLRSINGIPVQNPVYKHGQQAQFVGGTKTFEGGIQLAGPAHLMQLNGRDLSESYQRSIFTDRDYSIDSLVLDGASFPGGLLAEPAMAARQASPKEPRQQLREQLQQLEQQLRQQHANHAKQLLYLEHAEQPLEATWSTSNDGDGDNNNNNNNSSWQLTSGSGICQLQQLRAQLSQQRVHLRNVSLASRLQRISSASGELRVKAQNYCHQQQQKFRSRVHVNCRGHAHTLGLRQHVEALQLIERTAYSLLLISGMDEVRVLHVSHSNCSLSDWQSVQPASAGRLMKLVRLETEAALLLLTSGLEPEQHLPVVAVHRLAEHSQRFELLQHIGGDYDLAELQDQQLLLSCRSCRHIAVHVYQPAGQQFVPMQQLQLPARVQQLLPFGVAGERHLLVLTMPGSRHFYLFTYGHVEGWRQRTYGHMAGYRWSWPLIRSGQQLTTTTPLLLLCGQRLCSLVNALLD